MYGSQQLSQAPSQPGNTPQEQQLRQLIDELFVRYDTDRSFTLDRRELQNVFNEVLMRFNMGFTISQSEAEALLCEIDGNRDGKIGKPELFRVLRNLVINESSRPGFR